MEGRAGAVVVMDPRNGDVLAMVSTPAFDIDRFTGTIDRAAWLAVVKDPAHPLLNRAIQTQYAPGSVFKIIVAAAGLQEGTLTPMDRVHCTGAFHIGGVTFKDWKEGGHGGVDLLRAINQSCNVYFYHYGLKIGGAAIARYATMFGLGTHGHRLQRREAGPHSSASAPAWPPERGMARRRDGQHVDRPGRAPRHAHAGRPVHVGGGQRRGPVAPARRPARDARVRRGVERRRRGDRSRGAVAHGLGVPPPEPVVGRQPVGHRCRRAHSRAGRGRKDRHRADRSRNRAPTRERTTRGSPASRRRAPRRSWWWSSSSAEGRGARWPPPSRARS